MFVAYLMHKVEMWDLLPFFWLFEMSRKALLETIYELIVVKWFEKCFIKGIAKRLYVLICESNLWKLFCYERVYVWYCSNDLWYQFWIGFVERIDLWKNICFSLWKVFQFTRWILDLIFVIGGWLFDVQYHCEPG